VGASSGLRELDVSAAHKLGGRDILQPRVDVVKKALALDWFVRLKATHHHRHHPPPSTTHPPPSPTTTTAAAIITAAITHLTHTHTHSLHARLRGSRAHDLTLGTHMLTRLNRFSMPVCPLTATHCAHAPLLPTNAVAISPCILSNQRRPLC
jgi:hypothetical protein